jgi:putative copper export protein
MENKPIMIVVALVALSVITNATMPLTQVQSNLCKALTEKIVLANTQINHGFAPLDTINMIGNENQFLHLECSN